MATKALKKEKTAKEKLSEAKAKMDKKISDAKKEYADFKARIQKAKEVGYRSGAKDAEILPKGKGVIGTAKKSYGQALKDSNKRDKLNDKLKGNNNGKSKK